MNESIGERIKNARKSLKLTQAAFSKKLCIGMTSISKIESGVNNPSDQTITLICNEFNISETWLRTGEGSMYVTTQNSLLAQLQCQYDLSELEMRIIKNYLALPNESRKKFEEFIQELLKEETAASPDQDLQQPLSNPQYHNDELDGPAEEAAYAAYIKSTFNFAGNTDSSPLNGSGRTNGGSSDKVSGE